MPNTLGKPNLEIFADTLLTEAKKNSKIIVVTSDSRAVSYTHLTLPTKA